MTRNISTAVLTAAAAVACFASAAHAFGPPDSTVAGDKYGHYFRVDAPGVHGHGARAGRFNPSSEGARDVETATRDINNSRSLAGMDRRGVSAEPSRSFDVFSDGSLAGMDRRGVSADPSRSLDRYTDGGIA